MFPWLPGWGGGRRASGVLKRRDCEVSLRVPGAWESRPPRRPGHEVPGTPGTVTRVPPPPPAGAPCMADMAPALTGAPQEAPHRLKLSASSPATERGLPAWKPELNGAGRAQRSSLLLLNGGSERTGKSRGAPEAEDKPGTGVEEKPENVCAEEGAEPGALCALRAARMSSRQQELGARARRLCRRLQVIQAKQVERHVRQQLAGLVELLAERGAAGLPGSPHTELDRLASSSTARLRAAQGGFDSDATESSSGGESDGEASLEPEEGSEEERPEPG